MKHSRLAVTERTNGVSTVQRPPSAVEITLLWLLAAIVFLAVITHFGLYWDHFSRFGDNPSYIADAQAISRWDFHNLAVQEFWGLPYLMACVSWLHIPLQGSLLLICIVSSTFSLLLVRHLWNGWVAAFFAVLNFCWIQVSFLGGSEPLFVALVVSSFWAIRERRLVLASMLGAFATLVRPVGFFLLLALGLTLLFRRDFKKAFVCTLVASAIGAVYLIPFWIHFHDPLFQVHQYRQYDWRSSSPIGLPFRALAVAFMTSRQPWTNTLLIVLWIVFSVVALCAMGRKGFTPYVREHLTECLFAFLYLSFLFCYNSSWSWGEFPRFVLPVLPLMIVALDQWIPKSRYVLYGLGLLSSILGAVSAIGIRNALSLSR